MVPFELMVMYNKLPPVAYLFHLVFHIFEAFFDEVGAWPKTK